MHNQTIFISDLHLSEATPDLNELFFRALNQWRGKIDALYILGDFFDVWVGDDDDSELIRRVKSALLDFSKITPVYFIRGNRDFLIGEKFAQETGITLLPDQYIAELYGQQYLLTHGDEFCTDDLPYQQFRAQSRQPLWQAAVLAKPLLERKMLAGQIRMMSETKKNADGVSAISDVTEAGIQAALVQYPNLVGIIHGHTHRPNHHEHQTESKVIQRYVIPDWENGQGGYWQLDNSHNLTMHSLT